MNLVRVKAVANKEFVQIWRDPRSLGLGIIIPVILIVLFGYALSLDIDNIPMVIWDQDKSKASVDFLLNFKDSKYFKILAYYDNYRDMERDINFGRAMMGMVIPKDFSHYMHSNQRAPVQLILDGSDSNTAQVALGYAQSIVFSYNINIISKAIRASGAPALKVVDFRPRVWFNQDFESKNFIVPGLIAIIMMIIAALLTSLTIAREWERGTMEQLISTPVRPAELIIGKFIPYFAIGLFDLIVAVLMGKFVFQVPLRGSILFLFVTSSLFLTGALGLGIYISTVAKSQLMASQMAILASFLPTFLLSGFTYEIFNMPKAVQAFTYLIPARYFITILRGIYLKGVGITDLWFETICLVVFTFLAAGAAIKKFKKKIL
ncbi:MAG: ABC transporter permease [Candidatus Omnitrophica bacterium]|nr:ABC transporter permease [Candidatus Omnitrophota bacterium]